MDHPGALEAGIARHHFGEDRPDQGNILEVVDGEEFGAQAIVDVVVVIGNIVRQRRDLRLGARVGVKLEVVFAVIFLDRSGKGLVLSPPLERPVVLGDALEGLPAKVEPVELGVAFLQPGQDAQRLGVVVETAIILHRLVQRLAAGVAEGGVTEIVGQRQGLGQILVQRQRPGDGAGDLGDLEAVGQARAVIVALVIDEDLGLVFEAPEGRRMDDAVAVALKNRARRAFRFGIEAAAALPGRTGIRGVLQGMRHGGNLQSRRLPGNHPFAHPKRHLSLPLGTAPGAHTPVGNRCQSAYISDHGYKRRPT